MVAFDDVAEEVNHDDALGTSVSLAELRCFGHICQLGSVGQWIERLVRQIRRRARNVEEEEVLSEERREWVEGLAAQLYLATETRKEDEVFRKEVIRQMVKIIAKAIEIASAPVDEKSRIRPLSHGMRARFEEQIYRAAFQISTRRWVRTEEGAVVSLKRESQTAADHEVAQLKDELKIAKVCLSSANEQCTQLEEDIRLLRESKEKLCAELEEEIRLLRDSKEKLCAKLEEENRLLRESKEKQRAELEEENRLLRESKEKLCAELEEENRLLRESKEKLCAELEEEIRLLRGSRQREDSPEDGDLASPNSVSPSNFGLQVGPQDPAEGAAVRVETTPAPTGAERSETIKELKNVMKLSEAATFFAVGVLLGLLTFHRENESVEPQTPAYKAFKFCILVTFACGLSMSLLTICDFSASYKMPIIRGLVYETRGFLLLSGVCVCIAFKKAIDLLAFVPVIAEVIVACIIVYYKNRVSSGQPLPTNWRLLP